MYGLSAGTKKCGHCGEVAVSGGSTVTMKLNIFKGEREGEARKGENTKPYGDHWWSLESLQWNLSSQTH